MVENEIFTNRNSNKGGGKEGSGREKGKGEMSKKKKRRRREEKRQGGNINKGIRNEFTFYNESNSEEENDENTKDNDSIKNTYYFKINDYNIFQEFNFNLKESYYKTIKMIIDNLSSLIIPQAEKMFLRNKKFSYHQTKDPFEIEDNGNSQEMKKKRRKKNRENDQRNNNKSPFSNLKNSISKIWLYVSEHYLPHEIQNIILNKILMSLNIRLTNEFLMNPDFCTMKNSFEIQGKLSELKKWLNNNIEWDGLQGGLDNIKDTTKCLILHSIILEQKNNYIQNIENICPSLNLLQIKTLFQNFKADEIDTRQITNGDLNSFVEFIKQQANPNLDRVIIKNNESDVNLNDKNENSNNDDGSDGGDDGGDGDGDGDGDDEDDGDDESDESEKDDDEKDQIKIKENTVISTNIDFQFTFYEDWKDINPSNKLLSISAFKIVFESIDKILSSQNLN